VFSQIPLAFLYIVILICYRAVDYSGECSGSRHRNDNKKAKGIWLRADHFSAQYVKQCVWAPLNVTSNPDLTCFASISVVEALMYIVL
jgi:hypothetical protein